MGAPIGPPICPAGTLDVAAGGAAFAAPPAADTGAGPDETGELWAPVVELNGCDGGGATGGGNTEPAPPEPKPALKPREKSDGVAAAPDPPPAPGAADGSPPEAGETDDGNDSPLPGDTELGGTPPEPADDNPVPEGDLKPLPTFPKDDEPPLPPDAGAVTGGTAVAGVADAYRGRSSAEAGAPLLAPTALLVPVRSAPMLDSEVFPGSGLACVSPVRGSEALSLGRSWLGPPSFHRGSPASVLGAPDPAGLVVLSRAWMSAPGPPVSLAWSAGMTCPALGAGVEGLPPMFVACSPMAAAVSAPTAWASACADAMTASIAAWMAAMAAPAPSGESAAF